MAQHALLSPSAAHRWLHCTAAPLLEKDMPDQGSAYAEEGTLAHAYCAKKLKARLGLDTSGEDAEIEALRDKYHTGEMDEHTDTYEAIVWGKYNAALKRTKDAQLLVEVRLDFGKWMPDGFGTADAVIIADGCMEVVDFKYGKGVRVEAEDNPQMRIYAAGAYDQFSIEYDIRSVRMTIVQPRIDNLSEAETTSEELLAWADGELKRKAEEAYGGNGYQVPGEWCRFCKVRACCKALAQNCVAAVKDAPDPKLLRKEDIESTYLPLLPTIKTWLAGIEEYTLQQALDGVDYKGYKLVEGRSVRKIIDPEAVKAALAEAGYKAEDYMKPAELRTITDLEKGFGKKNFGTLCGQYIAKPQGKPTLVPDTDKRPAYNSAADDFKGIGA